MAILIKASGDVSFVMVKGDFKKLQELVAGYVAYKAQPIKLKGEKFTGFACNEDGMRLNLPFNNEASNLLGQPLVGDVVLVGKGEI